MKESEGHCSRRLDEGWGRCDVRGGASGHPVIDRDGKMEPALGLRLTDAGQDMAREVSGAGPGAPGD